MYSFPRMTKAVLGILIAHAVGFLLSIFAQKLSLEYFALYIDFSAFGLISLFWRVFTYQIVNFGTNIINLLFFGLFMWWVGSSLESAWGTKKFVTFYLVTSAVSGLISLFFLSLIGQPIVFGTSGITFSIIAVYAYFAPNLQFYIFGIFPIKVKWLLLISIVLTLVGGSPIAILYNLIIQLVTALVAVVFMFIAFPLPEWIEPALGKLKDKVENIKSRTSRSNRNRHFSVYKNTNYSSKYDEDEKEEEEKPAQKTYSNEEWEKNEVDRILDKISKYGIDTLTKKEKDFLDKVGKEYKSYK